MEYQAREGGAAAKQWAEDGRLPHHIDVADEVSLPGHIHWTVAPT
jgi:hypothetical protein